MAVPLYWVDAFTGHPFAGNPAAVCLLAELGDDSWMQAVAAELGLAETAFVLERPGGHRELRWFTPVTEVELCGHATLATAHVLWQTGRVEPDAPIELVTRKSGLLTCVRNGRWIVMDFPADPPRAGGPEPPALSGGLGVEARSVHRGRYDWLVELGSADTLRALRPDPARLAEVPSRGIAVTAAADQDAEHDFESRFFAPRLGVDEDPVTGSAHCLLAPFWAKRLGRTRLVGHQVSARGGTVRVEVRGDRVRLGGQAVTVWRGELDGGAGPPPRRCA